MGGALQEVCSDLAPYSYPSATCSGLPGDGVLDIERVTVSKAIVRARRDFKPSRPDVTTEKIRSHSSRHRWINDAKNNNIPKEVAMMYTFISNTGTYDKVYGKPRWSK